MPMTLAQRLQRLLDARGFSISEAAREAGYAKQQVHKIVTGGNPNPQIGTVQRIVEAVGATLGELFEDEE